MRTLTNDQVEAIRDVIDAGLTKLSGAALEKDIHLTQVLLALGTLENSQALTFCGGTSLSKCFNLIDRMSEDADFKFHLPPAQSKNASKNARKDFKSKIVAQLTQHDFEVEDGLNRDDYNYFYIRAGFTPAFAPDNALRDSILLEFTHVDGVPERVEKGIFEFVSKAQLRHFAFGEINCLTLEQTLAEKTLSFLSRGLEREAEDFDPRIVRHLYDIDAIASNSDLAITDVSEHFLRAIAFDSLRYSKRTKPLEDALSQLMAEKAHYPLLYQEFVQDLTVDENDNFEQCWNTFVEIASNLINLKELHSAK
jgi:predicted nucleotidyltransferase component of viral defense system